MIDDKERYNRMTQEDKKRLSMIFKMPSMKKQEYDRLIEEEYHLPHSL